MFHFKTVWCPYNETSHERDVCVFAHNWQDYRRRHEQYQYKHHQCEHWDQKSTIDEYTDACADGLLCQQSHGWKESSYHPDVYKVHPCPTLKDCKNRHCPYFHNQEEKRKPLPKWFKLFPRCRTVIFPSTYYSKALLKQRKLEKSLSSIKQTSFSSMT